MFLKIKKIPRVNWSSDKPYNFKPKFSTFFFLCFGLTLFGADGDNVQNESVELSLNLYLIAF